MQSRRERPLLMGFPRRPVTSFNLAIPRLSDTAPLAFFRQPSPAIKAGKRFADGSAARAATMTPMVTSVLPEFVEDLVIEMPSVDLPESIRKERRTDCSTEKCD